MRWTKLKQLIEERFSDKIKSRVRLFSTTYRGAGGSNGRGCIIIDQKEAFDMCSLTWCNEWYKTAQELGQVSGRDYVECYNDSKEILRQKEIYSKDDFYNALMQYLSLSIEEAMESNNVIIKSLSLLDRRLGKRRLRNFKNIDDQSIVRKLYNLRCEVEGINSKRDD